MKDTKRWKGALLSVALLAGAGGCRPKTDPTRADFTRGMQAYLEQRGDLCLGRPRWPIDVLTAAAPRVQRTPCSSPSSSGSVS